MKKIVSLLLLSMMSLWGVEFHSYSDALKLQKKNKKVIMIDMIRTDCRFCQAMSKNVLQDPEFSQWIDARFIVAQINLDNEKLPKGMHVDFTPTFYFVNHKGKIIRRLPGSWTIEDFKYILKRTK